MTDLERKEKELANWEEELQAHAREILERERALQTAERNAAKRPDADRIDYLFDQVNKNQRRMVLEPAPVIQIAPAEHRDILTPVLAAIAAVASLVSLIAVMLH